jgi:hypothetical protein
MAHPDWSKALPAGASQRKGRLDLSPWEQIPHGEFDGRAGSRCR